MTANIILLPIVLPMVAAVASLLLRHRLGWQRIISGIVANALPIIAFALLLHTRAEGLTVLRVGSWPGPYGIVFVMDLFSTIMLTLAAITHCASWWFVVAGALPREQEAYYLHPVFMIMSAGVNWAFLTGDLFNLFVSFEIILLASYILIAHGNEASQVRESVKYVIINILASTLFLVSAGYAYGYFGSLNMAELAVRIAQENYPDQATLLGTLLLLVFGSKAALFPLFYWLPDSYPKMPRGISAYFAGILTKVGVYCLYRIFTLIFRGEAAFAEWFQPLILLIGAATMLVGVLAALSQFTFRRILSFHIISQIGYMIFGLGLFSPLGLASGIFYICHHIIVKASLFLVADSVLVNEGSQHLKKVSGLIKTYPFLAALFLFAAFSLAGVPPLSGFYGKFGLVVAGVRDGWYVYVAISLLTSLFTIASMAKIWRYSFWGERQEGAPAHARNRYVIFATAGLVSVSILVAVASAWLMGVTREASEQLLAREVYIAAVLGEEILGELEVPIEEDIP